MVTCASNVAERPVAPGVAIRERRPPRNKPPCCSKRTVSGSALRSPQRTQRDGDGRSPPEDAGGAGHKVEDDGHDGHDSADDDQNEDDGLDHDQDRVRQRLDQEQYLEHGEPVRRHARARALSGCSRGLETW